MTNLNRIAQSYGTDKSSDYHNYCDKYANYLPFERYYQLNIMEIGVLNGESVKTWKEYFYRANILGIDINPDCKQYEDDKIRIEIGSQADSIFLQNIKEMYGPFDMILDPLNRAVFILLKILQHHIGMIGRVDILKKQQ